MSYIRPGEDGSDIYLYASRNAVVCSGCVLPTHGAQPSHPNLFHRLGHYETRNLDAMLAHLDEHRHVGHTVPNQVEQRLRDDWPTWEETNDD